MLLDSNYPGSTVPTVVVYRDHAHPAFLLCAGKIETWYNASEANIMQCVMSWVVIICRRIWFRIVISTDDTPNE
jgi:hypothetical protein